MKKNKNPNLDEKGDFVLRWKLDPPSQKSQSLDPFQDLAHDLLKELLEIVQLSYHGRDVKVDGFRFLNSNNVNELGPAKD